MPNPTLPVTEVNRMKAPAGQDKIQSESPIDAPGLRIAGVPLDPGGTVDTTARAAAAAAQATAAVAAADLAAETSRALAAEAQKVSTSLLAANNGVATLDGAGRLLSSQLPDIAIADFLGIVASQAAMLALTGQKGDWCTRSDEGKTYHITGSNPALIGSWTALAYPQSPVISVAGLTGEITAVNLRAALALGISDVSGLSDALAGKQATLANAATLAKISEAGDLPKWNGGAWPGGAGVVVRAITGTLTSVVAAVAALPARQVKDVSSGGGYADHTTFRVSAQNTVTLAEYAATFELNNDTAGVAEGNIPFTAGDLGNPRDTAAALAAAINLYSGFAGAMPPHVAAVYDGDAQTFTVTSGDTGADIRLTIPDGTGQLAVDCTGANAIPESGRRAIRLLAAEPGRKHAIIPGTAVYAYTDAPDWAHSPQARIGYAPFSAPGAGSVGTVAGSPFSIESTGDTGFVTVAPIASLSAPPANTDLCVFQDADETASSVTLTFRALAITFDA